MKSDSGRSRWLLVNGFVVFIIRSGLPAEAQPLPFPVSPQEVISERNRYVRWLSTREETFFDHV